MKELLHDDDVREELSNIIRGEIKDPRINPLTSVVAVEVAPDLKTCKAYISVLGDEKSQQDTIIFDILTPYSIDWSKIKVICGVFLRLMLCLSHRTAVMQSVLAMLQSILNRQNIRSVWIIM